MSTSTRLITSIAVLVAVAGCEATTHRVGQSTTVQFGTVRNARQVTLDSQAGGGALVGGTLGLVTGGGSGPRQARNAILGAGAGAALAAAGEGNREGMSYEIDMLDGSSVSIVTDQQQIMVGDCVAIERVRETANIRRVAPSYCDQSNARAVSAIGDYVRSDAEHCEAAKQELAEADSQEAIDLAIRKVELLCNA